MKKLHFQNLDSLRTLAFLSIFLHHGFFTTSESILNSGLYQLWEKIKAPAGFGVPLFFVLSGFLITYLILEERKLSGRFHLGNFYMRRILRIWPLYYAVVFFGFVLFPLIRKFLGLAPYTETADPLMYLLFLGNFDQIAHGLPYGAGLGVTWSLSVEEQFYIFWPLLLLLISGRRTWVYISCIAVVTGAAVVKYLTGYPDTHTLVCMAYLGSGALLAAAVHHEHPVLKGVHQLPKWALFLIYLSGIIMLYMYDSLPAWAYSLFLVFIGLYFAFVIYDQALNPHSLFKLGRLPWLESLGKYTYGFYLLHTISNFVVYNLFQLGPLPSLLPEAVQVYLVRPACSLLLTMGMGLLSFRYFEKPFLSLKKRFSLLDTSATR